MEITNVTYQGPALSDLETLKRLPDNLQVLLNSVNGFIQYGGGLHVRGLVKEPEWHSIAEFWTGSLALSRLYPSVLATDVPFAQDCVGDQFLLREHEVWRLNAETGEVENLQLSLKSFFHSVANDPIEFLGMGPLLQLQREGAALKPGQLLHAYPPFCTEESANGVSVKPVPAVELIGLHAAFAAQLPSDGESIIVRVSG